MRYFKIEIRREGVVVHSCEVIGVSVEDAQNHAWESSDPGNKIDMLDSDYTTHTEEL